MNRPIASRSDPAFVSQIAPHQLGSLETHPKAVYGLWPDLSLAYMNPAWFALSGTREGLPEHDDWPIGRSVLDAHPGFLRNWYRRFFLTALADKGPDPSRHDYECSSADVFRRFSMLVYPAVPYQHSGLLVVNSLLLEIPHARMGNHPMPAEMLAYADPLGLIRQCGHCRRVQFVADPLRWDWVPGWLSDPPANLQNALCPICLEHYYPSTLDA